MHPHHHRVTRPWWARGLARFYFLLLILILCLALFLWRSGGMLLHSDPVSHVRWAVVLAGEGKGMERSEAASSLFRQGRFDSLILSGPRIFRTHHESEFSAEALVSMGFPEDRIFQLPHDENSTLSEAALILRQARLMNVDTLLVITSNYHSARASRIYKRLSGGRPEVRVFAAEDPAFDPRAWWSSREGRVVWMLEWTKTLNTFWEMMGRKSLSSEGGRLFLEPAPGSFERSRPSVPLPLDSQPVMIQDTAAGHTATDTGSASFNLPAGEPPSSVGPYGDTLNPAGQDKSKAEKPRPRGKKKRR